MSRTFDVAVVGADGLVGEAMLALLDDRSFPAGKVHALAEGQGASASVAYGHRDLAIGDATRFDFSTVQLALMAPEASPAVVARAAAAGCAVIDASPASRQAAEVPLVACAVNPQRIAGSRILASPGSASLQLSAVLQVLHEVVGIARVQVTHCQAVSESGRAAVEELGRQTADLLSFRELTPGFFSRQIAFNLLGRTGAPLASGYTAEEESLVAETRRLLGDDTIRISASCVVVPVFYGHSQTVHVETRNPLGAARARELLAQTAGLTVLDEPADDGHPTAVTEASGTDAIYVGRIRENIGDPRGLNLWTVCDNIRAGAALNSVQIAERLVRDYL